MVKKRPTQDFVPIKEIRDGVVILKDGSFRSFLLVSSMNFSLKSVGEQEAIIRQFQNFLNSLDFPVQIVVQSRKLDIRPYIAFMNEIYKGQTNDLIRIQTREYIEFIKNFTDSVNIMSKNFFLIIPYNPSVVGGADGLKALFKKKKTVKEEDYSFEEKRTQLEQRRSVVEQGLASMGLKSAVLGTEEAVEVLYKMFNPGESEKPIQLNK